MPNASIRFTKIIIPSLTCAPDKTEAFFWDAALPGFGLRAYASGRRQWMAQYRDGTGRTRRASFGDVRIVELDDAREAARKLLSKVELGADPQAEKKAARRAIRLELLITAYLQDAERRLKPRSYKEVHRHLRTHANALANEIAVAVGRAEIVKLLSGIARTSGPIAANRVRSSLSAMWVWGLRSGMIDGDNPVAVVPKPASETARDRVLSGVELTQIWNATGGDHDHDRIVRLLMLTGARREEVASMEWAEVEGSLWTLPRARSKNGLPHEVPLGPLALRQMPKPREKRSRIFGEGEGGFSGWSRCKERLDRRMAKVSRLEYENRHGFSPDLDEMPLRAWTLHDLRRTVSTWMNEAGIEPHIVEAALNHVSGNARRGVAGVYNKAQYREAKRRALSLWEANLQQLITTMTAPTTKNSTPQATITQV